MVVYDNVKFTKGSNVVFIGAYLVEENIINTVKVIATPTTDTTPDTPKILNLNRVEKRFTISGMIVYGKISATSPIAAEDTATSGFDKKELLKTMFSQGSVVVLTYEGVNYNVAVEKFNIKYKAKDNTDSVDGEVVYDVIITCVYGEDIVV